MLVVFLFGRRNLTVVFEDHFWRVDEGRDEIASKV